MKQSNIKVLSLFEYDYELCKGIKTDGNFYDYKKYIIEKPWGNEFLLYQTKNVSLWILNLISNGSTSLHAHKLKDTYLIPINNRVRMNNLDKLYNLKKKKIIFIPKKKFHQSKNINKSMLNLIEIELPNKKNDIIRHHDYYGRKDNSFKKENHKNKLKKNIFFFDGLKKKKQFLINKEIAIVRLKIGNNTDKIINDMFQKFNNFFILNGDLCLSNKNYNKIIKKFVFYKTNKKKINTFSINKETDILFI